MPGRDRSAVGSPSSSLRSAAPASIPLARDPPADAAHPARARRGHRLHERRRAHERDPLRGARARVRTRPPILLHGFPGNERNLDLAQALRRAGWNAVFFHYRGSWGSDGDFSFGHVLEDVAAVVARCATPAFAESTASIRSASC